MKDRIEQILKVKNITATKFAEELDVQRSGISHILSGRNNPSLDFVLKIKETYPEFSLDWLLLGKGPMTVSHQKPVPVKPIDYSLFDSMDNDPDQTAETKGELAVENDQKGNDNLKDIPESKQADKKEAPNPGLSGDGAASFSKQVERIVVFYTDKTFDAYLPG